MRAVCLTPSISIVNLEITHPAQLNKYLFEDVNKIQLGKRNSNSHSNMQSLITLIMYARPLVEVARQLLWHTSKMCIKPKVFKTGTLQASSAGHKTAQH